MARLRSIPAHLRPRRLHLYGVGLGKSGTTTLARMFGGYRSSHECDAERFLPIAAAVVRGDLDARGARVRRALRYRSARHHLEADVANFLTPVAGTLVELYSNARFVLTIRDCFSWLNSRVEQSQRRVGDTHRGWNAYRAAQFERGFPFAPEEAPLRDAGLLPIAAYLSAWATLNQRVLSVVPPDRLLVLRTEELDGAADALARFTGVDRSSLRVAYANRNPAPTGLLADIPASFVLEQVEQFCAPIMEQCWGEEWRRLEARLPR